MSRIGSRDTGPERRIRSLLHRLGFRFSLRTTGLPGKPDIVLSSRKIAVFVHGCFWHHHRNCSNAVIPKTRRTFWLAKLESNVRRDRKNTAALRKLGWSVFIVWECELENEPKLTRRILRRLKSTHEQ